MSFEQNDSITSNDIHFGSFEHPLQSICHYVFSKRHLRYSPMTQHLSHGILLLCDKFHASIIKDKIPLPTCRSLPTHAQCVYKQKHFALQHTSRWVMFIDGVDSKNWGVRGYRMLNSPIAIMKWEILEELNIIHQIVLYVVFFYCSCCCFSLVVFW